MRFINKENLSFTNKYGFNYEKDQTPLELQMNKILEEKLEILKSRMPYILASRLTQDYKKQDFIHFINY